MGFAGGSLLVEIGSSTNCANPDDTVTLHASVSNRSSQIFAVELQDRPVLDLCIGSYPGYSKCWSEGKQLTPDLTKLELKPGESKTIEMKWFAQPAGSYGAAAIFVYAPDVTGGPITANVTVGVVPDCPGSR